MVAGIGGIILWFSKSRFWNEGSEEIAEKQGTDEHKAAEGETDQESEENGEVDNHERNIVFLRYNVNKRDEGWVLWIADPDGSNPRSLGIKNVIHVVPGNNKEWVFYEKVEGLTDYSYHAYNLGSGEDRKISPDTTESASKMAFGALYPAQASPDGKKVVFSVSYKDQDFAAVDPYPDGKNGSYCYDTEKDTLKYLGKFEGFSWSAGSEKVYAINGEKYHEYDLSQQGVYVIDVETGEADHRVSGNFLDFEIADGNWLVVTPSTTDPYETTLWLTKEDDETIEIDSDMTSVEMSPNGKYALYALYEGT